MSRLQAMVNIGGGPDKQSVEALQKIIVAILTAPCADTVKTEALKTLGMLCHVGRADVSNNSFVYKND